MISFALSLAFIMKFTTTWKWPITRITKKSANDLSDRNDYVYRGKYILFDIDANANVATCQVSI